MFQYTTEQKCCQLSKASTTLPIIWSENSFRNYLKGTCFTIWVELHKQICCWLDISIHCIKCNLDKNYHSHQNTSKEEPFSWSELSCVIRVELHDQSWAAWSKLSLPSQTTEDTNGIYMASREILKLKKKQELVPSSWLELSCMIRLELAKTNYWRY